jgi:hypothetical protein
MFDDNDDDDARYDGDLTGIEGRAVDTYDDERLGSVVEVMTSDQHAGRRYLVVESSLFGTGRYYVPEGEIQRVGPERILLKITRDDLRELDWLARPS